jgi:hypothetical protein
MIIINRKKLATISLVICMFFSTQWGRYVSQSCDGINRFLLDYGFNIYLISLLFSNIFLIIKYKPIKELKLKLKKKMDKTFDDFYEEFFNENGKFDVKNLPICYLASNIRHFR